jgi:spermidine/putrescine-binding protein
LGFRPPHSWAEFFALARVTPTYAPRAEAFGAALKMIGESVNTRDAMARTAARELVSGLNSVSLIDARMAVSAHRPGWEFAIPREGAELWEDGFCLPADSTQPDLAREFIRFALDAQPLTAFPENIPLEPRSPFAPPVA